MAISDRAVASVDTQHQEELRSESIGALLKQLSEQTSTLVKQELELARAELTVKGKQAGVGAGLLGGGGLFAVFAFGALTAALIALLATGMDTWIAALIVAVVYAAIAGVLALIGKNKVTEATPPAPQTVETIKEDVAWAKTPEVIRQRIEATRAEMTDTVDALGYKADVKARAKENVQGKVEAVSGRVTAVKEKIVGQTSSVGERTPSGSDLKDAATSRASDAKDSLGETIGGAKSTIGEGAEAAKEKGRQAASVAQENPIGLAVGAIALGFLGGLLVPATRLENEKIGPVADQIKGQVSDAGHEAFAHGKAVAEDAVQAAKDAAQSAASDAQGAAREAASTVRDSGQEHAQRVKASVGSSSNGGA